MRACNFATAASRLAACSAVSSAVGCARTFFREDWPCPWPCPAGSLRDSLLCRIIDGGASRLPPRPRSRLLPSSSIPSPRGSTKRSLSLRACLFARRMAAMERLAGGAKATAAGAALSSASPSGSLLASSAALLAAAVCSLAAAASLSAASTLSAANIAVVTAAVTATTLAAALLATASRPDPSSRRLSRSSVPPGPPSSPSSLWEPPARWSSSMPASLSSGCRSKAAMSAIDASRSSTGVDTPRPRLQCIRCTARSQLSSRASSSSRRSPVTSAPATGASPRSPSAVASAAAPRSPPR